MQFFLSSRSQHMRFSRDWSSDVWSSDLSASLNGSEIVRSTNAGVPQAFVDLTISLPFNDADVVRKCFAQNKGQIAAKIGRASCRERVYILFVVGRCDKNTVTINQR